MKKVLYRLTILFPLGMLYYSFAKPLTICIPSLRLFMNSGDIFLALALTTVAWLCCSPLRKSCCNGSWTELLFNLIPVEMFLMFVFAQRQLCISVLLVLGILAGELCLFLKLRQITGSHKMTRKTRKIRIAVFCKCSVLMVAILCLGPCLLTIYVYGLRSPTYQAEREILEQLFSEIETEANTHEAADTPSDPNAELWQCLTTERWDSWAVPERLAIVQWLADYETDALGIPVVSLTAGMIGEYTLGAYDYQTNRIWINTEHLVQSPLDECINTICHEVFHAYQHYLVTTLDWSNPALQTTAYFSDLRSWLINTENYMNADTSGYDAYSEQPLEVSARVYADAETAKILDLITQSDSSLE